jgi:CRP-like cAMP-binding protein
VIDALLQATPFFQKLSADNRRLIGSVVKVCSYEKRQTICLEGAPSQNFYIVVKGRVKAVKLLPSGKEIIFEIFEPGEPFGAVAVLEHRPYPASVIALEETTCIRIPADGFFQLLEREPLLVRGVLLGLIHRRFLELTNRIAELSGSHVEARLARLFLNMGDEPDGLRKQNVLLPTPLSRQDLANLVGTTIETCIRIMSHWEKKHIVHTFKDGFVILNRLELERLALL